MMSARIFDYATTVAPMQSPADSRDLVSVQDFSPEETRSLFELTHIIKRRPADFRLAR